LNGPEAKKGSGLSTGKEAAILEGHAGVVTRAAFSPEGKRVMTASWDNTARLWNADTGKEAAVLKGHTGLVRCAAFSPMVSAW
jgi:WD40 repeat protein